MATKPPSEEAPDVELTRSQFIAKLASSADAMRQFSHLADALAKVASKVPLDDPEIIEAFQVVIDATPTVSKKRKLIDTMDEDAKKRKRGKKTKDPNAPKAPPSAYIMFQNDVRNRVRQEHPTVQYKDLMGLISKQWNALPPEKKQPYFDRVNDAKKNHEVDMANYIAKHPEAEEGSGSKKPKAVKTVRKPAKKAAPAAEQPAPKFAPASSESGSDNIIFDSSDDEEHATPNGKQSDEEADSSGDDDESDEGAKVTSPAAPKKYKKSDKKK